MRSAPTCIRMPAHVANGNGLALNLATLSLIACILFISPSMAQGNPVLTLETYTGMSACNPAALFGRQQFSSGSAVSPPPCIRADSAVNFYQRSGEDVFVRAYCPNNATSQAVIEVYSDSNCSTSSLVRAFQGALGQCLLDTGVKVTCSANSTGAPPSFPVYPLGALSKCAAPANNRNFKPAMISWAMRVNACNKVNDKDSPSVKSMFVRCINWDPSSPSSTPPQIFRYADDKCSDEYMIAAEQFPLATVSNGTLGCAGSELAFTCPTLPATTYYGTPVFPSKSDSKWLFKHKYCDNAATCDGNCQITATRVDSCLQGGGATTTQAWSAQNQIANAKVGSYLFTSCNCRDQMLVSSFMNTQHPDADTCGLGQGGKYSGASTTLMRPAIAVGARLVSDITWPEGFAGATDCTSGAPKSAFTTVDNKCATVPGVLSIKQSCTTSNPSAAYYFDQDCSHNPFLAFSVPDGQCGVNPPGGLRGATKFVCGGSGAAQGMPVGLLSTSSILPAPSDPLIGACDWAPPKPSTLLIGLDLAVPCPRAPGLPPIGLQFQSDMAWAVNIPATQILNVTDDYTPSRCASLKNGTLITVSLDIYVTGTKDTPMSVSDIFNKLDDAVTDPTSDLRKKSSLGPMIKPESLKKISCDGDFCAAIRTAAINTALIIALVFITNALKRTV